MRAFEERNYEFVDTNNLERTRYFSRQLVTAADLRQDQEYFREKMRRHNRLLHGWGIVCGLEVAAAPTSEKPWRVSIRPGYALSPQGDEIYVTKHHYVDLVRLNEAEDRDANSVAESNCPPDEQEEEIEDVFIAIRYSELLARPIHVHPAGCNCSGDGCEFSRIQDGYEIAVLAELPDTHRSLDVKSWIQDLSENMLPCSPLPHSNEYKLRSCPDCPSDPWVILAHIPAISNGQSLEDIELDYSMRRYVITFANLYLICPWEGYKGEAQRISGHIVKMMGVATGLVDLQSVASKTKPVAMVTLFRQDGSPATMQVSLPIDPDETFASLVKREGDREFYDPVLNEVYRLRELYALANVDPDADVQDILAALAPLDSLRLEVAELRESWISLESTLDKNGLRRLDDEHLASPSAALRLPATDIRGLSPRSKLGKKLTDIKIADIVDMGMEDFLELATKNVSTRSLKSVVEQAELVWQQVIEIDRISRRWHS